MALRTLDIIGNKNLDADENGQERILRFFSAYSALVRVPKMALTNYQLSSLVKSYLLNLNIVS